MELVFLALFCDPGLYEPSIRSQADFITARTGHRPVATKFGDVLNKLALIWTGDDKPT